MLFDLISSVNCGVPRPPGNGTIVNYTGTLEGSTVFYQCNFGFGPQGVLTAVCTANGSWIPDPARVTCRKSGIVMHVKACPFWTVSSSTAGEDSWFLGWKEGSLLPT